MYFFFIGTGSAMTQLVMFPACLKLFPNTCTCNGILSKKFDFVKQARLTEVGLASR